MKTVTTVVHMTLRLSGLLLILLGLAIWTGRADQVIPIHMYLGFVLVLSLWTLAFIAARTGVSMRWVILAVVWGVIAPILGMTQEHLLVGNLHWTIQILHLLIGLGAIGQGEGLTQRMRRIEMVQLKAA